jgi:hypothetical protein
VESRGSTQGFEIVDGGAAANVEGVLMSRSSCSWMAMERPRPDVATVQLARSEQERQALEGKCATEPRAWMGAFSPAGQMTSLRSGWMTKFSLVKRPALRLGQGLDRMATRRCRIDRSSVLATAIEVSERAAALRQCPPFAGILSSAERFAFLKAWAATQAA